MGRVKIFVGNLELENLAEQESQTIWGELFVKLDGYIFPHNKWYDAVSSVLDMWTTEILNLDANEKSGELYFMDGPYCLKLRQCNNDAVEIRCYADNKVTARVVVNKAELINEIINSVHYLLQEVEKSKSSFAESRVAKRIASVCKKLHKTD